MINLLLSIAVILSVYSILIYLFNKRIMPWQNKALIYWGLTLTMLVSAFLAFDYYDKHWKKDSNYSRNVTAGRNVE